MYKNSIWDELAVEEAVEQPNTAESTTEPVVSAEPEVKTEAVTEPIAPINEYEIDGEKYTLEQIKEFRTGSMRQADYTKKTQEIAETRKQNADAIELYQFLKDNPDIASQLSGLSKGSNTQKVTDKLSNPSNERLDSMSIEFETMKINNELNLICAKDKTVTDLDILQVANKNNVNVETAYNIWKGQNSDKILKQKLAEQSLSFTNKIKENNNVTKTLIKPGDITAPSADFGLSADQLSYATKLGMTAEEYKKWS